MLVLVVLVTAGSAWAALQGLPLSGAQVNDDGAAGIPSSLSVNGQDPANSDVAGGALVATAPDVPWSVFRQTEAGGLHDQLFSRSFAAGAWATRGAGTVGGRSSPAPIFSGSLNFDQSQDAEAPAIDFAGVGRAVPWATWYESTTGLGTDQVFASRFDATQNRWLFAGQSRGLGGGTVPIPSLNLHTGQDAVNPSVAGGSTSDPTRPGPWVTWQETSVAGTHTDQIFVVRPIGPASASCTGVKPAAIDPTAAPVGGFCWQQAGIERVGGDPSLNVDPTRNGLEPDIAFTGTNDSVPWVVWYEQTGAGMSALRANELVFAAKGTAPPGSPVGTVDGSLVWTAVGSSGQGALDASAGGGPCGATTDAEGACSLNADPSADAEDPRIAAGTMDPAAGTVPWVAWDERVGTTNQVFVSRLVGGTHFVVANGGQPLSSGTGDSTRPDITFSGNTPFVSWREHLVSGTDVEVLGHLVNAANPTFVLDSSSVVLSPTAQADVREPISSTCIATPFDGNGAACQGGAIGTPFDLYTSGSATRALLAHAYDTGTPVTAAATGVTTSAATLNGSVDPQGGPARVSFQFGATTAYDQTTTAVSVLPTEGAVPFSASIGGLAAGATVHYRAVAATDFGTRLGPDQTLTTPAPTPMVEPPAKDTTPPAIKLKIAASTLPKLLRTGRLRFNVSLSEAGTARVTATLRQKVKRRTKPLSIGKTTTVRFTKGGQKAVTITLSKHGKVLLRALHRATITIVVAAVDRAGNRSSRTSTTTLRRR